MSQKQKTPTPSTGKPESAETLAGNKLAELQGKNINEALEAASKINLKPEVKKKERRWVVCSICYMKSCPLGYWA